MHALLLAFSTMYLVLYITALSKILVSLL